MPVYVCVCAYVSVSIVLSGSSDEGFGGVACVRLRMQSGFLSNSLLFGTRGKQTTKTYKLERRLPTDCLALQIV